MEDQIQMLERAKFPLATNSCTAMCSQPGGGKTYFALKFINEYMRISTDKYDWTKPYDVKYCPFTHIFWISGTAKVDRTLKYDKNFREMIIMDSDKIEQTLEMIMEMTSDFNAVQLVQEKLFNIVYQNPKQLPDIQKSLKLIELMKIQYPQLRYPCNNQTIRDLYKLFGVDYDGYLIRRPRVFVQLDDVSAEKYFQSNANIVYSFITKRRHYCTTMIINVHSIMTLYGKIRGSITGVCLFKDLNRENIKMLFDTTLGIERANFSWQDFMKIYEDHTGFNDDRFKGQQTNPHNMVYVMTNPEKHITLMGSEDKIVF